MVGDGAFVGVDFEGTVIGGIGLERFAIFGIAYLTRIARTEGLAILAHQLRGDGHVNLGLGAEEAVDEMRDKLDELRGVLLKRTKRVARKARKAIIEAAESLKSDD